MHVIPNYKIVVTTTNSGALAPVCMGPLDLLNHLLNFLAPALAVGLVLAVVTPIFDKKRLRVRSVIAQVAINSIAGAVALALGLWFFGHDGKMASYGAMVAAVASCQWWAARRRA